MSSVIVVKAAFDPEAGVWVTESADIHGLRVEDASFEALIDKLPGAIQDLLEHSNCPNTSRPDVPIEIIAHASTRVRLTQAA